MATEDTGKQGENGNPSADAPVDLDGALKAALSETFEPSTGETSEQPPAPAAVKSEEVPWDKFDLSKAPQEIREKLFREFQPNLQKRIDDLDTRQKDLYDRALKAYEQRNAAPPPVDIQAKLKEAIEAGDLAAVAELSTAPLREEISQIRGQLTRQQALEQAVSADKTILENEAEIASRMQANPVLLEMASVAGHRFAPFVLQGVNAVIQRDRVLAEYGKLKTDFKAAVEAAVKADRAARTQAATRLGPSGTNAGTSTPRREEAGPMSLEQALREGYDEAMASAGR